MSARRRYDPLQHHRRSTRLRGFDYSSPGAYFVTVCVRHSIPAFGALDDNGPSVHFNVCGNIVAARWQGLTLKYPHVQLDTFVVMPDHFHAIVWLVPWEAAPSPRPSLSAVMGFWKYETTQLVNEMRETRWAHGPVRVWQRGFYDRILRTHAELDMVRHYIRDNPQRALPYNRDAGHRL